MKKIILLLFLSIIFFSSCQSIRSNFLNKDMSEVTIGYMKYEGSNKSLTYNEISAELAVNAAIDYINRSGTIPFKIKLKTLVLNNESDVKTNAALFSQVVSDVSFWIASTSTDINLSLMPSTLVDGGVPLFLPGTSRASITQGYDNIYQTIPSNIINGYKLWELLDNKDFFNIKDVLVIQDSTFIYSGEHTDAFITNNKINNNKFDITLVSGSFSENKNYVINQVQSALKQKKFDAILVPSYSDEIREVFNLLETLDIKVPIFAGDYAGDPQVFKDIKGTNPLYYVSYFPIEFDISSNPNTKSTIESFQKFYESSGEGLIASQYYYSVTLLGIKILQKVLENNPNFINKANFYEAFHRAAVDNSYNVLSDFPIQLQGDGSLSVSEGELNIIKHTKLEGLQLMGRL